MQITVTGAGGFLGKRLVKQLLKIGTIVDSNGTPKPITKITACDISVAGLPSDSRVQAIEADASDPAVISRIVTPETKAVFHLAAIVSVGAEEDFELGMRVNFDGTRLLLEACRKTTPGAFFLFASSAAVYGGELPHTVEDGQALAPQTSYGIQKAIGEFLINDYSRRGFVNGRALRLPTIVVRAGVPNKAASTFASSIIREPLQGKSVVCPVAPQTEMCLLSPRKVIKSFIHAQTIAAKDWGFTRAVQLPGITMKVGDMIASLRRIAGDAVANRVRFEPDPIIEKIVYGWPGAFNSAKARRLGFEADASFDEIVSAFIEDDLDGKFVR